MAIYAIGDIQGCLEPLQHLLERCHFDPANDQAWFTGDLVNRGPDSLGVLRFVRDLGPAAITVLGNHDLHLLAIYYDKQPPRRKDTFDQVLAAPDCDELMAWLLRRPMFHHSPRLNAALVHAGVPPFWNLRQVGDRASEVEAVLRGGNAKEFFAQMYGNQPYKWRDDLSGWARIRYTVNALTRMRFCDHKGVLEFEQKGDIASAPNKLVPWFNLPGAHHETRVLFGHWSMLGHFDNGEVVSLDTGCLWGRQLTAYNVESGVATHFDCPQASRPKPAQRRS